MTPGLIVRVAPPFTKIGPSRIITSSDASSPQVVLVVMLELTKITPCREAPIKSANNNDNFFILYKYKYKYVNSDLRI